ncbi:Protein of unknown function [Pyronema omphalodes CBS 100304]|uniref:Uncharacterized protein n=1 Tax=Pyronema omphalodes (strain CBS 100304) TaxID=1076935 RepID=U4LLP7_PYROM|nr:Protein of unknown function [Pyronema omphalodes CBS 100304]
MLEWWLSNEPNTCVLLQ